MNSTQLPMAHSTNTLSYRVGGHVRCNSVPCEYGFGARPGGNSSNARSSTKSSRNRIRSNSSPLPTSSFQSRVVVMGASGVGKTSLVSQFLYARFPEVYTPTVEDLHHTSFKVNRTAITLDILDTSGTSEFPAMRKLAIDAGDAFLLVFSVDNKESFQLVCRLREQILEQKGKDLVPIVVVGNKIDIDSCHREIEWIITEALVSIEWDNVYVETSAINGDNILEVFTELLAKANVDCDLSSVVQKDRPAGSSCSKVTERRVSELPFTRTRRKGSLKSAVKLSGCSIC